MSIAIQAGRLIALAKSRTPANREELLLAITDLCDSAQSAGVLGAVAKVGDGEEQLFPIRRGARLCERNQTPCLNRYAHSPLREAVY